MGTRCRRTHKRHRGLCGGDGIIPLEELTTGTVVIHMKAVLRIVPVFTFLRAGWAVHGSLSLSPVGHSFLLDQ
jgi:hypothetical protein